MWRLLGKTWVVADLAEAARAAAVLGGDHRFVTRAGDVLEGDGRVRVGAGKGSAGMITRRSELAELESRQIAIDEQIAELSGALEVAHMPEVEQVETTVGGDDAPATAAGGSGPSRGLSQG